MSNGSDRRNPADRGHATRQPRAKKDTKRWCAGKVGREHVPTLAMSSWAHGRTCQARPEWAQSAWFYRRSDWWCHHRVVCETCGKVLAETIPLEQCPDRPDGWPAL